MQREIRRAVLKQACHKCSHLSFHDHTVVRRESSSGSFEYSPLQAYLLGCNVSTSWGALQWSEQSCPVAECLLNVSPGSSTVRLCVPGVGGPGAPKCMCLEAPECLNLAVLQNLLTCECSGSKESLGRRNIYKRILEKVF